MLHQSGSEWTRRFGLIHLRRDRSGPKHCWFRLLLAICLAFSALAASAQTLQDGYPDPRFGSNGLVKVSIPNANSALLYAIDQQRDSQGRYWLLSDVPASISSYHLGLARLLPDGTLDTSFSGDGFATPQLTPMNGESLLGLNLAFSNDGKVLIAGQRSINNALKSKGFVCRLTVSGALDASFADQGCARPILGVVDNGNESPFIMRVQPDGRILLIGSTEVVQNQSNQRAGYVLRLLANGQIDTSLGAGLGWVLIQPPDSLHSALTDAHPLPDGDLLVTGYSLSNGAFVLRLNGDGSVDSSWAAAGLRYLDLSDLHSLPNARVIPTQLQVGIDQRVSLCARLDYGAGFNLTLISAFRLDANGALDPTFSDDGRFLTTFEDVFDVARVTSCHLDASNRLLIGLTVGNEAPLRRDFGLLRLLPDGHLDPSLGGLGKVLLPLDLGGPSGGLDLLSAMFVQGNSVSLFGTSTLDNTFNGANGYRLTVLRVGPEALLTDGFE